jgi:hypothetical protein
MFPSCCPVVNLGVLKEMGLRIHPDPERGKYLHFLVFTLLNLKAMMYLSYNLRAI